jgi:hypothetical protein
MAEMHPVLSTRLSDRRLSNPHVRVVMPTTFTNRSSDLADSRGHVPAAGTEARIGAVDAGAARRVNPSP